MTIKQLIFVGFVICTVFNMQAQKDTIAIDLEGFSLSISKVKNFSKGYYKNVLSDSLKIRNIKSLTEMLRFNSFIYFKENGLGMVSSPSFRGTNASQTAVIWNGININSQLNGQTDFNAISAGSYDVISVRSGGGSVLFGSGAIGGTVHLNNNIFFKNIEENKLLVKYGSFNTTHISYNFVKSSKKSFVNFGLGVNNSSNNFKYLNSNLKNDNGSFFNTNFDVNFGYKFNKKNQLKVYSNNFFANRNLSRTINAPSNDAYEDISLKNLIEWDFLLSSKETITSRVAFLFDEFKFFDNNKNKNIFSIGVAKRKVAQIDYNNNISRKLKINAIVAAESTSAEGSSFNSNKRTIYSSVFSLNHQLTKKISYGVQLRQDLQSDFNAPFLYSLGIAQEINKNYTLSFNTSKNFRIPTFNDLYWNPGGNSFLNPENSYQLEIGNTVVFKNIFFQINGFYIRSSNLIQWRPNNIGIWMPENVNETKNIGIEFSGNYKLNYRNHFFRANVNYSFTNAKDLKTNKQLIQVPKNRATILLNYNYKNFTVFYQLLANDNVSFLVDTIPSYSVSNVGFNYKILNIKNTPNFGFKINNIYNTFYQNTLNRPMPGINFQITTNINF